MVEPERARARKGRGQVRTLRERLAALQPSPASPKPRRAAGVGIEAVEPGTLLGSPRGEFFVVERFYDDPSLHALQQRCPIQPTTYLPDAGPVEAEEIAFLDTETTGLAGGTGTHVFLVGLGFFRDDRFVLRQFFMRHPGEEVAMLDALQETLARFRMLVTFNGRSFDWPLIETRFLIHGYRPRFDFEHFDVLHPARRVWKHRLDSCSLGSLEASLFGVIRTEDVPGFLIPQLYFDYLRDGDARRLRPVFAHNREDIVTMARLTDLLLRAAEQPVSSLPHPADRAGLGMLLLSRGDTLRGIETLMDALAHDDLDPALRRRSEVELSRWLKRVGRSPEAVPLWLAMCERAARRRPLDLYPFEELAKYYEHVARDLAQAEQVVERALRLIELRGEQEGRAGLIRRLARIRQKRSAQARRNRVEQPNWQRYD